jgi:hypothetical protein
MFSNNCDNHALDLELARKGRSTFDAILLLSLILPYLSVGYHLHEAGKGGVWRALIIWELTARHKLPVGSPKLGMTASRASLRKSVRVKKPNDGCQTKQDNGRLWQRAPWFLGAPTVGSK